MSGRALFSYKPELFKDDDDAVDENAYEEEKGAEETQINSKVPAKEETK